MNRLPTFFLLAALASSASFTVANAAPADEIAQRMTALSVRQDVTEADPRVVQAHKLLDRAVKLTREEPMAIEAACSRYVGHLHDSAHIDALPLDFLEALAVFGKAGKPMRDTLQEYVVARKASPGRSHDEAMAALGKKK